jgi:arylsulfatase A-like enzyme
MWFDQVPEEKRLLFKDPRSLHESYANSVHLADLYLKEFFAQLEARPYLGNSLVVVVGDHSFPTREQAGRGRALEEVSEEAFRTPLLVLWPGRLSPRRFGSLARSQMDIGPSLLDLLGVEARHHFVGTSIFDAALDRQPTIFLVQPYGGTSVAEVIGPMKYVKNLESGREFLYDLERDPDESRNLIRRMRGSGLLKRFQEEMRKVHLNQRLLEEDRIWPRDVEGIPGAKKVVFENAGHMINME